jgi:hypothetical protein
MTDPARPGRGASGRAVLVDLAAVGAVSVAIALAADQLSLMTVLVPTVVLARFLAWARLPIDQREHRLRVEVAFFAVCTAIGAFNDWSSVVRYRIYDYTVPYDLEISTIPLWMLLFWGMILRFVATLARWSRLHPLVCSDDRLVGLAPRSVRPGVRVVALVAFVLITRAGIYRWYDEPIWSWLPFAVALVVYPLLFPIGRGDLALAGLAVVAGPLIEILYIGVGGLHRYHQGVLAGVPVWIVLWWALIVPIWRDLSFRITSLLVRLLGGPATSEGQTRPGRDGAGSPAPS